MHMAKDFNAPTYIVDDQLSDTLTWLCQHQDCFDAFHFDVIKQELTVYHANGADLIKPDMYLNANYGLLITS